MHVYVYLPLAVSLLAGLLMPAVVRRMPPAHGAWLLSVGGVVLAAASSVALGLLALTLVGQISAVASYGHWTAAALHRQDPISRPVAVLSLIAVPVLAALAITSVVRSWRGIRQVSRLSSPPGWVGPLVVVDRPAMTALAVPGRPGSIVVSKDLLAELDPFARRVVLAHEWAHLRHRHHLHLALASAVVAVNPLLLRYRKAMALVTERWADEDAARSVGDRERAAAALASTALLTAGRRRDPAYTLAVATSAVPERVAALLSDPPRPQRLVCGLLAAATIAAAVAAAVAMWDAHQLVEVAQALSSRR
jgi:Zn-dependent protease with chaperone function